MAPRKRSPADPPLAARLPTAGIIPGGGAMPAGAPLSPTDERRERDLEELLGEIGSDGRIRVWHVIEGKSAFAGDMSLDGFSLDVLLDTFGGGEKSLVFYQGRDKVDTLRVSLDPSIPPRNPRSRGAGGATTVPGAPGGPPALGELSGFIAAMAQSSMSQMQMMQTMMLAGQQQSQQMLQTVTAVLTARPEKDPMDVAVKIAELLKPTGAQAGGLEQALSMLDRGMNIGKAIGGGGDDGTLALAKEGLQIVSQVLAKQPAVAPPIRRALPAAPVPGGPAGSADVPYRDDGRAGAARGDGSGVAEPHPGTTMSDRAWVAAARPSLPLLSMMIGNVSPATAAQAIADRLSDAAFADLIADIEADTPEAFADRFAGYFDIAYPSPDVRAWVAACAVELAAMMEDEHDGDGPGAGDDTERGDA